jgi:hypothetical protein
LSDKRHSTSDLRGSLLNLVAGTLDGVVRARAQKGREAAPDDLPTGAPGDGDFLYDLLRINVQYVNQLARLGSNYSILAARALERFYDAWQPVMGDEEPEIQCFEVVENERIVVRVPVENLTDTDATYTVSTTEFRVEDEAVGLYSELKPHYQHPSRSRARSISFSLKASEHVEVRLGLVASKALVVGADYCAQVVVNRARSGEYEKLITKYPVTLRRRRK